MFMPEMTGTWYPRGTSVLVVVDEVTDVVLDEVEDDVRVVVEMVVEVMELLTKHQHCYCWIFGFGI